MHAAQRYNNTRVEIISAFISGFDFLLNNLRHGITRALVSALIGQFNPDRGVVAGVWEAAAGAIKAGGFQFFREDRIQQEMVYPKGTSDECVPPIPPSRFETRRMVECCPFADQAKWCARRDTGRLWAKESSWTALPLASAR